MYWVWNQSPKFLLHSWIHHLQSFIHIHAYYEISEGLSRKWKLLPWCQLTNAFSFWIPYSVLYHTGYTEMLPETWRRVTSGQTRHGLRLSSVSSNEHGRHEPAPSGSMCRLSHTIKTKSDKPHALLCLGQLSSSAVSVRVIFYLIIPAPSPLSTGLTTRILSINSLPTGQSFLWRQHLSGYQWSPLTPRYWHQWFLQLVLGFSSTSLFLSSSLRNVEIQTPKGSNPILNCSWLSKS